MGVAVGMAEDALVERWRATVPGERANRVLCDPASASAFVSDGWGVAHAALRVHRLEIETGEHRAMARTRHQTVAGMVVWDESLLIATDSRFIRLDRGSLEAAASWDKRVVGFAHQLVPTPEVVVAANWLRPSIGVFDPSTGITHRLSVGRQPMIFMHGGLVHAVAGFEGAISVVDLDRRRLVDQRPSAPLSAISVGREVWGVRAGPPTGGAGEPPVFTRHGTQTITRLTGESCEYDVGGKCDDIAVDDQRGVIWCTVEGRSQLRAVALDGGEVIAAYGAGLNDCGMLFCHVDPVAGLAFALGEPRRVVEGHVIRSSSSTLVCYELPRQDNYEC